MGTKETDGYRVALVTFKGSNGTGCGTFSFDHFSHEAADGEAYERVRTLEDFDGEAGWMTYRERNGPNYF